MTHYVNLIRRYLERAAFVLRWSACELYFHLRSLTSRLAGIPLIALLQVIVARRPLHHQLWARDAAVFWIDPGTLVLVGALALACAILLCVGSGESALGFNDGSGLFLFVLVTHSSPYR